MKLSTCCQAHASIASDEICSRCGMHAEFTDGGIYRPPRDERTFDEWYAANEMESESLEWEDDE